jgi:hypothetical protein
VAVADLDFVRTSWVDESKVREAGLVVICETSNAECVDTAHERFGAAQAIKLWRVFAGDGSPASVTELFYAPKLPSKNGG